MSKEIEGRVTKKLSQEFSGTESWNWGALFKLEVFLWNPQVRALSGRVPRTSRNIDMENQEPLGNRCQNECYPELEFSDCRSNNSDDSDPEGNSDKELFSFLQDVIVVHEVLFPFFTHYSYC